MKIIDPGHLYEISIPRRKATALLKFVKRSGGAITYPAEWSGIQTQAVMRALIKHLDILLVSPTIICHYPLWQLGVGGLV